VSDVCRRVDAFPLAGPCVELAHEVVELERLRHHLHLSVAKRPLITGPVGVDFNSDAVGIREIHRFAHVVIGVALHRPLRLFQVTNHHRQRAPAGDTNREMIQPRRTRRSRWRIFARREHDQARTTSRRRQGGCVRAAAHQLEAEHIQIECERSLQIAHAQVHVADARRIGDAEWFDRRNALPAAHECSVHNEATARENASTSVTSSPPKVSHRLLATSIVPTTSCVAGLTTGTINSDRVATDVGR
jgi:hypothetical protein